MKKFAKKLAKKAMKMAFKSVVPIPILAEAKGEPIDNDDDDDQTV